VAAVRFSHRRQQLTAGKPASAQQDVQTTALHQSPAVVFDSGDRLRLAVLGYVQMKTVVSATMRFQ